MTLRLFKAKLTLHPLSVAQKPGYCTMLAAAWTELAELSSAVVEADLASAILSSNLMPQIERF